MAPHCCEKDEKPYSQHSNRRLQQAQSVHRRNNCSDAKHVTHANYGRPNSRSDATNEKNGMSASGVPQTHHRPSAAPGSRSSNQSSEPCRPEYCLLHRRGNPLFSFPHAERTPFSPPYNLPPLLLDRCTGAILPHGCKGLGTVLHVLHLAIRYTILECAGQPGI